MINLLLIGGGHSHSIFLKLWQKKPILDVQITLISNVQNTPYSGMLPAYIAGFYCYEECHINLVKLAKETEVQLILDEVINIDANQKFVDCRSTKKVTFDILSIDIGSTPNKSNIQDANLFAIPIKPVHDFLKQWQKIIGLAMNNSNKKISITIIGGGAGGVELAFSIHHKLINILAPQNLTINLIDRGKRLLPNHNLSVSQIVTKKLIKKQINLYTNKQVKSIINQKIILTNEQIIDTDYIFLLTEASAPMWLKNNSIDTNDKGFILVKNTLQTINYPNIFASGDIANIQNSYCPKAGVFAVKQGKYLYYNIVNYLLNKPLKSYYPQKKFLNIIVLGDRNAVASWGNIALESSLIWYWKRYLDHHFMKQFY